MIPNRKQYGKWSLPSKWSFWSAVIGIPLAIVSLIFAVPPLFNTDQSIVERKRLVFVVAQEMRYNSEWLMSVASAYERGELLPVGSLETKSLLELMGREHARVTTQAYGEEKYIYQRALTLAKLGTAVNSLNSKAKIDQFDQESTYTLHDVIFLNEFLRWYLRPMAEDELSAEQIRSLG